jgi:hypothetical protein
VSEWSNKTVYGLFQYTSSTDSVSEWSNKTVYGLFQCTSSTDSVSEWSNKTVDGLFKYTSSTECQNGVTQLFVDCSSILVVQRVRME